ncbi:Mfa1 family fimbria major subunit [Bacteroides sp. AN502(2024)]|uniref:Mfa1 family fimbria major subunit n=1 Tax=Bacteroides sp. AN502(2024) TaxID=3160599 RepID=UPI003517ADDB
MNRKLGILSLFLSVLFAGCSSDESVINEGGEDNGKDLGYIAVNIVQPGAVTGRSATVPDGTQSGGFVSGDEEENFAGDATFIIYKKKNDASKTHEYLSTQTIPLEATSGPNGQPAVEKIYSAVLVIDADDDLKPSTDPAKDPRFAGIIYCVLNAPKEIKEFDGAEDKTEATLQGLIGSYGSATKGSFIMSNSTYRGYADEAKTNLSEDVTCGTQFTTDNYKTTPNEALANPVDIYVERVVARVDTKKADPFNNEQPDPFGTNDNSKKLTIRITGMEIANIATKSYLFKNVSGRNVTGSGWPTDWNNQVWDANNTRCYWETVPTLTAGDYINQSYTAIVGAGTSTAAETGGTGETGGSTEQKVYGAFSNFDKTLYIQPNTSDNKTAVLVTAQLLDNANKPADLVWIKGGYFTNTDALKLVCSHLKAKQWAIKTSMPDGKTEFRNIEPTDLDWARYVDPDAETKILLNSNLKDYQAIAQVKTPSAGSFICKASGVGTDAATEIKKKEGETETSYGIDDLNGASVGTDDGRLASETSLYAEVFKNGLCYYFVNIDQTGVLGNVTPAPTKYEGVVRNHIYELTLSSIKGIGTAVFDPEQTIIPVKPPHDEFYYLAARINVLKWKFVKQNVSFEGN